MSAFKSISDIAVLVRGVTYKRDESYDSFVPDFVPVLRAMNIVNGNLIYEGLVYIPSKRVKEDQKIRKNDVVIAASTGSKKVIGKAAIAKADWEGSFGAFCMGLRPDKEIVDPKYFGYYFQSKRYRAAISHMASGANINNLKKEHFDRLKIYIPSFEEQRLVVEALEKADDLRKTREVSINLLDEYLNSIFLEMFGDPRLNTKGWEIKPLKDVVDVQSGLVDPRVEPYSDMIHIGGADIEKHTGEILNKFHAKSQNLISGKYLFDDSYILYSKIRPYLNKVVIPNFKGICSADIYPIRPKEILRKRFLAFILRSKAFLEYAQKNSGRANIPKINRPDLLKFKIIVPPVDEQEKFENIWKKVDSLKQPMLAQSDALDDNFNALMQKAFKTEA